MLLNRRYETGWSNILRFSGDFSGDSDLEALLNRWLNRPETSTLTVGSG